MWCCEKWNWFRWICFQRVIWHHHLVRSKGLMHIVGSLSGINSENLSMAWAPFCLEKWNSVCHWTGVYQGVDPVCVCCWNMVPHHAQSSCRQDQKHTFVVCAWILYIYIGNCAYGLECIGNWESFLYPWSLGTVGTSDVKKTIQSWNKECYLLG
jgi:hypothetical protein